MSLRFLPWSFALALLVGCSTVSRRTCSAGQSVAHCRGRPGANVAADAARDAQGAAQ